jgi:hypothetical protein
MAQTIPTPQLLTDPGCLFYAPLGTALPANTVAGGVFTDAWPVAWKKPGMTADGTEFHPSVTVSPITAAEAIDPIAYRTTDRSTTLQFALMSGTATNLALGLNGATTTVTGAAATTLTQVSPVGPGLETRYMWGWESINADVRLIAYQGINSGDLSLNLKKAPSAATFAFTVNLEVPPSTGKPFDWFFAGVARA